MGELKLRGRIWWVRYCRDGRRFEESSRSSKRADAERMLKIREGAGAQGVPITPEVGRLKFEDATSDLLNEYQVNGRRSYADVKRGIELHLKPFFQSRRMATITTADVRAYVAHRQNEEASNATINRELAALKRAFNLAVHGGRLLSKPHIPMLEERNARQGFFEREQFESVRSHLPAALQAVVTFAYWSGWRVRSEVLPLRWAQVDRKAGTVRLEPETTKNREGRTLMFAPIEELRHVIEAAWAEHVRLRKTGQLCPFVFHREGSPIRFFRRAWLTACKAAGCPGRVPHDFRRTAVRNLERAGVPRAVAMAITGHKTESVYRRYDIVDEADLQRASEQLARAEPRSAGRHVLG